MGSYAKQLGNRLRRPKFVEPVKTVDRFQTVVPAHPMKYPHHRDSKGSVYGGYCNVTRCPNTGARMFNIGTRGYYCRGCADGINYRPNEILCVQVDHNLTHAEMDQLYSDSFLKK